VYSFIRRQGVGSRKQKIYQGFFALLLERRDLDAVRMEKGRLRSYLLTSVNISSPANSVVPMAVKRGKGQRVVAGWTERDRAN